MARALEARSYERLSAASRPQTQKRRPRISQKHQFQLFDSSLSLLQQSTVAGFCSAREYLAIDALGLRWGLASSFQGLLVLIQ